MTSLDTQLAEALSAAIDQPIGLALRCSNPAAVRNALFRLRRDLAMASQVYNELYIRICPSDRSVVWITKQPGNVGRPKKP